MSEVICWVNDGEKECHWQKAWKHLYRIACDMAKSNNELEELLNRLHPEDEEE